MIRRSVPAGPASAGVLRQRSPGRQIKKELVSQIAADSTAGEELLDVFLVAKYLERIGDHATNLAEWVEYALTGTRSKDGHWEAPDGE